MHERNEPLPFSALEYMEFTGRKEFKKFRFMPRITDADIERCDVERLAREIQEEKC